MTRTFYVRAAHRWVGRPAPGHWAPAQGVMDVNDDSQARAHAMEGDVGIYAVDCRTKGEAPGVLAEWALRGRPSGMSVRVVWESKALSTHRRPLPDVAIVTPAPDVDTIDLAVRTLTALQDDPEVAHGMEDRLWEAVLHGIATGMYPDPTAAAAMALQTKALTFDRWTA